MRRWILLGGVLVGLLACKKEPAGPTSQEPTLDPRNFPVGVASCGQGGAVFQVEVRSPNGRFPVPGAVVYVEDEDCGVTTDANGQGTLRGLSPGDKSVVVQAGLFSNQLTQSVQAGTTSTSLNISQGGMRFAVFYGAYDAVQNILDSLGFTYDFYQTTDTLLSPDFYSGYDMIFINCGANELYNDTATYLQNMQNFVNQGGRLYVSDLAIPFFADMPFDSQVHLWMEEAMGGYPYGGLPMDTTAWAVDSLLVNAVGLDSFLVQFASGWIMLDTAVAPGSHVLVEGPASPDQGPVVVPYSEEFNYGSGKVFVTSFHLEGSSPQEVERFLQHLIFRF